MIFFILSVNDINNILLVINVVMTSLNQKTGIWEFKYV